MKPILLLGLLTLAILIISGEAFARYVVGLGTPPLSVTHARIEYMFAPGQDVQRFGNRQLYNELSMRSAPLASWGDDRRVLVFGDSVLNGGNLTDHEELATTLATKSTDQAVFANISAGSWGIDNFLGWIEVYGMINADAGIIVLSSHDAGDAPTFDPLNPMVHPTRTPPMALWEAVMRYFPRYLPFEIPSFSSKSVKPVNPLHLGRSGVDALPDLILRFASTDTPLCIILHNTLTELKSNGDNAFSDLVAILEAYSVPMLTLTEFAENLHVQSIYRDDIHINEVGQSVLAVALISCYSKARIPKRQ